MEGLSVSNVSKSYGNFKALDNISFDISNGITALLGNNGAGKTTLINIIVGLLQADCGLISFNDIDYFKDGRSYRNNIGFLPQECGFYESYTAYQFLEYMGYLKNIKRDISRERIEKYLKMLNLWDHRNKKIKQYSGGMKHRLGIVQAILNEPQMLILDEPTTGLDYSERKAFQQIIKKYAENHTVILSTHIFSDVEKIADNILILKSGQLVCNSKMKDGESLSSKYGQFFEVFEDEV